MDCTIYFAKTKVLDQLLLSDLCLCFGICKNQIKFSHDKAQINQNKSLITKYLYNKLVLVPLQIRLFMRIPDVSFGDKQKLYADQPVHQGSLAFNDTCSLIPPVTKSKISRL